jgi:TRAP-type C4-dicarboxylate transport system permease small subunit
MICVEPYWIKNLRHALVRMDTFMAGLSLLLLLSLVFGQVLMRNLLNSSIPHADILARYLVLYVTFFGVAACMRPEGIRLIRPPLYLISALVCAVMTWAAVRFWYDDWQYVAEHERWSSILALITPFGFGLLTLHFLLGWPAGNSGPAGPAAVHRTGRRQPAGHRQRRAGPGPARG